MNKFIDSDWIKAMQFSVNKVQKRGNIYMLSKINNQKKKKKNKKWQACAEADFSFVTMTQDKKILLKN